jgi:hypothetical protein
LKIISHRGNTSGPNKEYENHPNTISSLLKKNIDCEIDVWFIENKFYLGHDFPQHDVEESYILQKGLWCHAKNLEALYKMNTIGDIHFFWHENDDYTLTSKNIIWTYPDKKTTSKSIIVDLNKNWRDKNYNCLGVCVDWI